MSYWFNNYVSEELYEERPEPVVFTSVLPDAINTHLRGYVHNIVDEVDGKKITCLKDMHDALNNPPDDAGEFVVIKLLEEGRPLVLERARIPTAQTRILRTYNVPEDHYLGE